MNQQMHELVLNLPYPLSSVVLEVFKLGERWESGETVPNLPFDICRAGGLLLRTNAAVSIAAFLYADQNIPELNSEVVSSLRTPADGTWLNLTQRLLKSLKLDLPLFSALGEALNRKVEIPQAVVPGEDTFEISAKDKKAKAKKITIRDMLSQLIKYRNKVAHGDHLTNRDHADALAKLRAVVGGHEFYTKYEFLVRDGKRWLSFDGPGVRELGEGHHDPDWWTDSFKTLLADFPDRAVTIIKVHPETDIDDSLQLTPLLHYSQIDEGDILFSDLFFVNRGTADAAEYIAYHYEGHVSADGIGSYEAFREMIQQLPTPSIPKEKRLEFAGLAEFHAQRFVGREDVLREIKEILHQTDAKYIELRALAGMGKTAILTRFYMDHGIAEHLPWPGANKKPPRPQPVDQDRWAFHFCMPTDGRDDPMVALQSIVCQLCDGAGLQRNQYLANEMEQQQKKMVKLLDKVTDQLEGDARVIICIDALDEGIPNYGTHTVPNVLIGESEENFEKNTGMALPDGVIFLVSYRVDDEGASRVDDHLEHIPEEWRQRLDTADPLNGLTQDDVSLLLNRLAGEANVPEASEIALDTTWKAATSDTDEKTGANPFFLRFIGDGVLEGDVDLSRPESIPADLGSIFEQAWMSLPSESNYALHRILGTLAILQEYGTDELMLEVVNASLPTNEVLPLSDLRSLRAKAGKLLVYDGDRYGLFHDRLRWFLIGKPSDRLDMALSRYEKLDPKGRFGPRQVAKLHGALADLAERWNHSALSALVKDYILHYGPHHQIMAGRVQDAVRSLTDYPTVNERLKSNRGNAWVEDLQIIKWANESGLKIESLNLFRHWEDFARENRHIIDRANDEWPANKILLQLAVEHSDISPVTQAAEKWLKTGFCNWPWLRKFGRRKAQMLSPVLQVFEGHKPVLAEDKIEPEYGYGIVDAFMLDDNRLVSYAVADPCIRVWDIQTGKVLKKFRDKNFPGLGMDDSLCDVAKWDKDTILFLFNDDLMMWDVSSGETIKSIKIPLYKNWCLDSGLIIGQKEDDSICVFDIKKEAVVFECNWKNCCDYKYLATGKLVIYNDQDPSTKNRTKRMEIWDLQSKKLMHTVRDVKQPNHFIQITDDIFAVSEKKIAYVINADTGEIKKLAGHSKKILGMFKTKNMLCTWSQDGWLGVWDIKTYEKLHFVEAHEDIISINVLEENTDLAISFSEHSTKVWKLEKGEFTDYDSVEAIENAYGNVAGIIDRDSEYVIDINVTVIPLIDSCICVAKAYSTNPEMDRDKEIINRGSQFISLFSGDGSMGFIPSHENGISGYLKTNSGDVITWGEDNRLVMISKEWGDIWSRQLDEAEEAGNIDELIENDNDERALIQLKNLQIPNIVPLSENRIVIYEYDTRGMILWNPIKREIESIIDTDEPETPHEIHVQDENIIFVEYETKIKKWNVTTKEVVSFEGHEELVCDFFVINKDRIATKDAFDIYRIWNSSTGECLLDLKNISELLEQSLNENGEFLCSRKKELVLIDGKDGKVIRRFPGYSEDAVITCAAIPDQRWLISSEEDKKIRLWGRDNPKCLAVFDNHKDHEFEYDASEEFVQLGKELYLSFFYTDIKLLNIDDKTSISLGFDGDIDIDGYCVYPDLRILIWGYDFDSAEMLFRLCNGTTGKVYEEIEHKISGTGFELKYYLDKLVAQYNDAIEVMDPDTLELQSVSEKELEKYSKPFLTDKDQLCFIQENRVIFRNPRSSEMLQWHSDKIKSDVGDLKAWENDSVSFDSEFLQLYYGSKPVLSSIKRN